MPNFGNNSLGLSRVMIFIDGGYLRKQISEISNSDINYVALTSWLTISTARGGLTPFLKRVIYYDAIPDLDDVRSMPSEPDPSGVFDEIQDLLEEQKKYLEKINHLDLFDVRLGKLAWNAQGKTRQKGVDSLIAIDMLTKAFQNQYDEAVLLAGDSDFLEIVKAVKSVGPHVTGAYFKKSISKDLVSVFDKRHPLEKGELIGNNVIKK